MAYKIKKTFKVELVSPDGKAVLEFKRPLATRFLKEVDATKSSGEQLLAEWQQIAADCVSVEGMEYDDGTPVSADEIKSFSFDLKEIIGIVQAYNAWVFSFKKEDEAKKNSESGLTAVSDG